MAAGGRISLLRYLRLRVRVRDPICSAGSVFSAVWWCVALDELPCSTVHAGAYSKHGADARIGPAA